MQKGHDRSGFSLTGQKRSAILSIARLLVTIMKPKNTKGGEQCNSIYYKIVFNQVIDWENFDRIYRATLPFIHPENAGAWSVSLASFYDEFSKLYIRRALKEQRAADRKNKKSDNNKEIILADSEKFKDDDEDVAPIEEVDLGLLGDDEEEEQEKEGEDDGVQEDDDDEQDISEPQDDLQTGDKKDKLVYKLDDTCHAKFLEIIEYVLKNLVYSRDNKVTDHVAKISRVLS